MIPMLAQNSDYYNLITGSLNSVRGYSDISEFYSREFNKYFDSSQWRSLLDVGDENRTGRFTQVIKGRDIPVMASYVADDGDAPLIGNTGFELQNLEMPKSKLAYMFNEKSVEEGAFLVSNGAREFNSQSIFNSFLRDNVNLIGGINVLRSYSALQAESLGAIRTTAENKAGGMIGIDIDFRVPSSNRKKVGFGSAPKFAWSNAKADPVQDLLDLVAFGDKEFIDYGVFRMNKATFNVLLNHPATRRRVLVWKTGGMVQESLISEIHVGRDDLRNYLSDSLGLPAIEVVDWRATSQVLDASTQSIKYKGLTAFADNVVLLRPAGKFGVYDWKRPNNLFATQSNPLYYAEGGMTAVQQLTSTRTKSATFTAEGIGIPIPYDVTQCVYLDISKTA